MENRHTHSEHSHRGLFLLVDSSDTGGGVVVPKLTEKDFFITSPVNKKYIMNWYAFIIPRYTSAARITVLGLSRPLNYIHV